MCLYHGNKFNAIIYLQIIKIWWIHFIPSGWKNYHKIILPMSNIDLCSENQIKFVAFGIQFDVPTYCLSKIFWYPEPETYFLLYQKSWRRFYFYF